MMKGVIWAVWPLTAGLFRSPTACEMLASMPVHCGRTTQASQRAQAKSSSWCLALFWVSNLDDWNLLRLTACDLVEEMDALSSLFCESRINAKSRRVSTPGFCTHISVVHAGNCMSLGASHTSSLNRTAMELAAVATVALVRRSETFCSHDVAIVFIGSGGSFCAAFRIRSSRNCSAAACRSAALDAQHSTGLDVLVWLTHPTGCSRTSERH